MMETPPCYNLLAEPLRDTVNHSDAYKTIPPVATHSFNLPKVINRAYSQNLGCDIPALMLALPHVRKFTATQGVLRGVVTKRDCYRLRKEDLTATDLV